ncbi:hypothetical protein D9757_008275 [Collybiopsis confluens]|uniref:separase n=1 Tax=Collybiopsis confluens TaxID=2823264 RepID=A0A8H5H420_9AGAR|nr:hypothetical protein D9757_008275 [Collybiopsis confluens]
MPATTASRTRGVGTSRDTKLSTKTSKPHTLSKAIPTAEQLASQLAKTLTIDDDSTSKGKETALSIEKQKVEAMRAINIASQQLSDLMQNEKKVSDLPHGGKEAHEARISAAKHLAILRRVAGGEQNVERAAMSILGKLVALQLYEPALAALTSIHPQLCSLVGAEAGSFLSIPIPQLNIEHDTMLLTLICSYFLNSIIVLSQTQSPKLLEYLSNGNTLLEWIPCLSSSGLPSKHVDSILTKVYSVLMKYSSVDLPSTGLFEIRMYALRCLALTSPGTLQKPDNLWDQAIKIARAFIDASSAEPIPDVAHTVTAAFLELVSVCETRSDNEVFLSAKGFATFCQSWIGFASKACSTLRANSVQILDRIANLMHQPLSDTSLPVTASTHLGSFCKGDLLGQGTHIYAAFAQLLAVLDQKQENEGPTISRIREVRNTLAGQSSVENGSVVTSLLRLSCRCEDAESRDKDLLRIAGKVDRALGRVRKSCLSALQSSSSDEMKDELLNLAQVMVTVYEGALRVTRYNGHLTHLLDTLFTLSRTMLDVKDPRTYGPVYDLLAKATKLLCLSESSSVSPAVGLSGSDSRPDFIRCTSGAFYNIGGFLYQAERYSSAIPFLKEGCKLGDTAILEAERTSEDSKVDKDRTDEDVKSSWTQLRDQLWRRHQLLGVCYLKIGDRRTSFDTFICCINAFPYRTIDDPVDKVTVSNPLNVSPVMRELQGVVERMTQLGACELLLPSSDVCLTPRKIPNTSSAALRGLIMEWQIRGLDGFRWQDGVRDTLAYLLFETLNVYREGQMPVRSLKMLAKALELTYHSPIEAPLWNKHSWLHVERIEEEMKKLCGLKGLGMDSGSSHLQPEYEASIHLWLALHAHRRSDPNQVALASSHTELACKILHTLLSPASSKVSSAFSARHQNTVQDHTSALNMEKPFSKGTISGVPKAKGKPGTSSQRKSTRPSKRKGMPRIDDIPNDTSTSESAKSPPLPIDSFESLPDLLRAHQFSYLSLNVRGLRNNNPELSSYVLGMLPLPILKIKLLDLWRKLEQRCSNGGNDRYLSSSSALALEYLRLGKGKRAHKILNQALATARSGHISDDARALFFLTIASSSVYNDEVEQSVKFYQEASTPTRGTETTDKSASSIEKIQTRVRRIERTAFACEVFASIQSALKNTSGSVEALLQALRLWNRAFDSLARLQPPDSKPGSSGLDESNPFEALSPKETLSALTSSTPQISPSRGGRAASGYSWRRSLSTGLEWRVIQGLLGSLFSLSHVYLTRGSPREAQYFAEQGKELSQSMNTPGGMSRALLMVGEVKLFQGLLAEGCIPLEEIEQWATTNEADPCKGDIHIDLAEFYRLKGDLQQRGAMIVDARKHYRDSMEVIERVNMGFGSVDGVEFGPRLSVGAINIGLFPELLAQVLSRYAWLLRADRDQNETFNKLLEKFDSLPLTSSVQSQKRNLLAKLALDDALQCSRIDMFLSSIGETTIALSAGRNPLAVSLPSTSMDFAKKLEHTEGLFWSYLSALGQGNVHTIRESAISIAMIKTFQASLGRADIRTPLLTAGLLDASSSFTANNEMLEAITNKFTSVFVHDGLEWPRISQRGVPLSQCLEDHILQDTSPDAHLHRYWDAVRHRHQSYAINTETLTSTTTISELPCHWTIVHISVTEDKNTMFISRQRGGEHGQPLVFCVPLKGRREDAEDEHLTFEDALIEMNEIVRLSNETTKVAASIHHDRATRAKWWGERKALDTRLRELLENIEYCWLGAFKTILSKNPHLSPEAINSLRIQLDRVFQRGLRLQDRKTKERALGHKKAPSESLNAPNRVTLDDALVECFSTLASDCRDEELEDLVYFVLDLYQIHGVPVAIAEVDIDQVVIDLRSVLEQHAEKIKNVGHGRVGAFGYSRRDYQDEHLFLVLDKNIQGLPWENIPILQKRSVSRIPSMAFLFDRVHFSRVVQTSDPIRDSSSGCAMVDPRKVYYIINPSGDLERTEERFSPWLKAMEKVGWQGISGRAPSELQVLNALQRTDLVIYFGHGGAEQYVRSHKLRSLPRCAAVMLWGCSSGALKDMGDFDRVGTPLNYMYAGCPTLVANLWDVTDKDIDTFSQSVFDKLHIFPESIRDWPPKSDDYSPLFRRTRYNPFRMTAVIPPVFATAFRLASFLFLRVIPSPLLQSAIPALLTLYLLTASLSVKPARASVSPATALLFSIRSPSRIIRWVNIAINTLLFLCALDLSLSPYFDDASNVIFSRIGAVSDSSVKILVRYPDLNETIHLVWRESKSGAAWSKGPVFELQEENDWVDTVTLSGLWPNTNYEYALAGANSSLLAYPGSSLPFRTFPDPHLLGGHHWRFIVSSCVLPNFPYVPLQGRRISGFDLLADYLFPPSPVVDETPESNNTETIHSDRTHHKASLPASFLLFLGDFIYADVPVYFGNTPESYRRLYRRNYQSPSFRRIYERLPMYHAIDDHEIINNFAGGANDSTQPYPAASNAFQIYGANGNPTPSMSTRGLNHTPHYYDFCHGDAAFFVMDTRRYRTPTSSDPYEQKTMLGEDQMATLLDWLGKVNNTATFKFLVSSVPLTSLWGHDAQYDSWAGFVKEKNVLLNALHTIPNVFVLSGDRHEFAAIEFAAPPGSDFTVTEFSTSPLSMFYIPLVRTLSMQSSEKVTRIRTEHKASLSETDGPSQSKDSTLPLSSTLSSVDQHKINDDITAEEIPKERVVKYIPGGNYKWSSIEIDTRDSQRPTLRLEVMIDGKVGYRHELIGTPVKSQASTALGAFVTSNVKDMLKRIGMQPSKWF